MKLTYASYAKAKDFTCLGAWCLLHGPEQHLKRQALARMRAEVMASAGLGEATWETLEGAGVTARDLMLRGQTLGLFGGARGIAIFQAERIDRKQQDELAKLVAPLSSEVSVILVTSESGDRRARTLAAALRKAVETHGLAIECPQMKVAEAAAWAVAHAKTLGKRLEPAAAQKLASQRVGTGLGELASEVEKLSAYVGDAPAITVAEVDAVTPRLIEEDVFRLLDAVTAQQPGRAVGILRPMLQEGRSEPWFIIPLLAQAVREIWQAKLLLERGWRPGRELDDETAAMLPQEPRKNALKSLTGSRAWLVRKRVEQAGAFSWARLTRALLALHSCDLAMKGIAGRIGDEETALELLIVQLCTDLPMPVWQGRQAQGLP